VRRYVSAKCKRATVALSDQLNRQIADTLRIASLAFTRSDPVRSSASEPLFPLSVSRMERFINYSQY
jgi:hypothetical protein